MKIRKLKSLLYLLFGCYFFLTPIQTAGQKAIWKGKATTSDGASQFQYKSIEHSNKEATKSMTKSFISLNAMEATLDLEHKETTTILPSLLSQKIHIGKFINQDSKKFIKTKYPRLKPNGNNEFLKNSLIQLRFNKKFYSEYKNVNNYLAIDNAIAESDRMYLLLSALEKVIEISIENEKY
ncbi:hypothetical protein [Aquimarina sp. RZ0]|uniref:hypothetical protein n=1 Tax=Aquimarina sp. RZ0 TaxID=2607730 RepID=UPI0011F34109|nr:hypothetical protein [Aquimarina sp. RZ0]KAA1242582.1 hypothetical protein F0000_25005 [Aquimarina sp. RZ0]